MNISDYINKQLQSGEEVSRIVRSHPMTLFPSVGIGAMLILIDFFLVAWWFRHNVWGAAGFAVTAVIGIMIIIRGVYVWRNNVLAITNQRVIDIDQRGFFERNVAEVGYDKIQDVRYTIRGFWPTIFRFGTIVVQTAGEATNIELSAVQHPVEVQRLITDLQRQSRPQASKDMTAAELLTVVDRLKQELGPEKIDQLLRKE